MDPFDLEPSGFESAFSVVFGLVALGILLGFAFSAYSMYRGYRASRRAGIDPFTPDSVLLAQAVRGRQPQSLEQRLAELDDLHRRGVISSEEHRAARAKALTDGS